MKFNKNLTQVTPHDDNIDLNLNYTLKDIKSKQQFKQLNYYSMPNSILFVVRKRLNLLVFVIYSLYFIFKSFM